MFARIQGLLAPEANQVVLFRRGPSRHTQQLLWNLDSNQVVPGQWIKDRVYIQRCDVTPDGTYLILDLGGMVPSRWMDGSSSGRSHSCYTVISRPPFFTALAIWFSGPSGNGGGAWTGNRELLCNRRYYLSEAVTPPDPSITWGWFPGGRENPETVESYLESKSGWFTSQFRSEKRLNEGFIRRIRRLQSREVHLIDRSDRVVRSWTQRLDASWPMWIESDALGGPIWADEGCLWRWKTFPDGEPTLIGDLNPHKLELVPPPDWALQWAD